MFTALVFSIDRGGNRSFFGTQESFQSCCFEEAMLSGVVFLKKRPSRTFSARAGKHFNRSNGTHLLI
jgi:hypothetical protein